MTDTILTLEHVRQLTPDTYELVLSGELSAQTRPGQFINLQLPGKFLRRPISVAAWSPEAVLLIVREAGEGTRALVRAEPGARFPALTGLGNGFDAAAGGDHPVLIGGGVGAAPLYGLAQTLLARGVTPAVALGFRTAADIFYLKEFLALGCQTFTATEDGSAGTRGFVTDLAAHLSGCRYAFVCGPTPMLKAVYALPQFSGGQYSFESRMACGFGACMGCTIETASGPKRVCRDGPVFRKEEIVW